MTKLTLYKKGYLLRIESWESDADNYKTKEVWFETEEETKMWAAFCRLFYGEIANLFEPDEDELEDAAKILVEFYEESPKSINEPNLTPEQIVDSLIDKANEFGLSGGDFYTRVLSELWIFKFDNDVVVDDLSKDM